MFRLELLCSIKSSGQDYNEKNWGTSVHCPPAAAAAGVGGGGESHHSMDGRGLRKFVFFAKVKSKGEK